MKYAIEAENLHFFIASRPILNDISLQIPVGCFAGILGANGAGKTTLLKCFNGIYQPQGQLYVLGREKSSYSDRELARTVSLMNQNTNLDFAFSCQQVVEFGRYPHWKKGYWAGSGDRKIVEEAMAGTNTLPLAPKSVSAVSGGERQRVLFAKLMAQDTPIILLDEPTASLDLFYQEQIFQLGLDLAAAGKTVIAAVHDLGLAARYCSQFYLLRKGQLLAQGSSSQVLTAPHIKDAYGIDVLSYHNPLTGSLEISTVHRSQEGQGKRVHILAGSGRFHRTIFDYWQRGYQVSCCPMAEGDLDLWTANTLGVELLTEAQIIAQTTHGPWDILVAGENRPVDSIGANFRSMVIETKNHRA